MGRRCVSNNSHKYIWFVYVLFRLLHDQHIYKVVPTQVFFLLIKNLIRGPLCHKLVCCFVPSMISLSDGLSILCELCLVSCGVLQVETIGDAYCVAGGLHKESETHAVQIALMALKMMELSDEVTTPTGEVIRVSSTQCALSSFFPTAEKAFSED